MRAMAAMPAMPAMPAQIDKPASRPAHDLLSFLSAGSLRVHSTVDKLLQTQFALQGQATDFIASLRTLTAQETVTLHQEGGRRIQPVPRQTEGTAVQTNPLVRIRDAARCRQHGNAIGFRWRKHEPSPKKHSE
jgi:hypothetical protein